MRWFERIQQGMRAVASFLTVGWGRIVRRDKASIEAMQWVLTLHSCCDLGPLLPEFNRWLDQRPINRDRFNELWDDWQELSVWKDRGLWKVSSSAEPRAYRRIELRMFASRPIATSLLVVGIAVGVIGFSILIQHRFQADIDNGFSGRLSTGVHRSGRGESQILKIVDGSTIMLRESSEVSLDFRTHLRHVQLVRGEARFNVAKNGRTPFVVRLGSGETITAVGTTFWVTKKNPGGRVKVDEGEVDLAVNNGDPVRLKAGDVAEFEKGVIRLLRGSPQDGTVSDARSRLKLVFSGEPLRDAVYEFNRYNQDSQLVVDQEISRRSVGGEFYATNPRGFARTAIMTWGMKCSIYRDSNTRVETIHLSARGARSPPHEPREHVC